ncbi:hypothetical protein [Yoonia sp.]|jgi:hypothetical protein|uniref:hypothetical protein n=1 Tax=Yoonia sp. TaxID=2212373 RepID=UPI0025EF9D99|nr:hypothetical protein [Yoonia sp.]
MNNLFKIALTGLLLTACTTVDISQPPIAVTPTNRATAIGLDVYGRDRARGATVPRFRGQELFEVRTFGNRNGDGYGEMTGASCNLDSGLYQATFTTPANILVPDYGPDSPAIFIQCAIDGKTSSATVNAVNLTSQQRSQSAAGAGLLGALIIGAVNESKRNNETDDFGYNPIRINIDR